MRALSLFSGIGGIDLAAEWAGIEVVAMCEIEPFAKKVLKKHWPNVPLFPDIRKLNRELLEQEGVIKQGETIELIYGGFPCQPFSIAGKRKGKEDDRDLWPEMFRVIQELKPTWIVGENVANFVNMELERTLVDLENEGYETQTFIIPACGVDAKHQRNRTFVVAYSRCTLYEGGVLGRTDGMEITEQYANQFKRPSEMVSNTNGIRWETFDNENRNIEEGERKRKFSPTESTPGKWQLEPNVGRVANGIPNRVDRLKGLGNAVVPQQIYPILKAIVDIEEGKIREEG